MRKIYLATVTCLGGMLLLAGCDSGAAEPPAPVSGSVGQAATATNPPVARTTKRIMPGDLVYQGAFRLPEGSNGSNWEYSGQAMTYFPDGDPQGPNDGCPGSLFAVGHDHHQMISEISIPKPIISKNKNLDELNTATTLQPFHDVTGGCFGELELFPARDSPICPRPNPVRRAHCISAGGSITRTRKLRRMVSAGSISLARRWPGRGGSASCRTT